MSDLFSSWFAMPNSQRQSPLLPEDEMQLAEAQSMPMQAMPSQPMQRAPAMAPQARAVSPKDDFVEQLRQSFAQREAGIADMQAKAQAAPSNTGFAGADLRPALSIADGILKTNSAAYYSNPKDNESLKERLLASAAKNQDKLADDKLSLAKYFADQDQSKTDLKYKYDYLDAMKDKADGQLDIAKDKVAKEKTPTGDAYKAAGFARRLQQSEDVFNDLSGQGYAGPSRTDEALSFLPNEARDPKFQSYDQSARNFVNATLRRESGASISPTEFANARAQYLPTPGDSAEVLAQKAANRRQVFESFKAEGGPAFRAIPYVSPKVKAPSKAGGEPMVSVQAPSGKIVQMPASEAERAIKAGGKRVE